MKETTNSDSHQDCIAPYPYQVVGDPVPWIYLVPPLNDQLYVPCAGNYTSTAYSGDPNKGLGVSFSRPSTLLLERIFRIYQWNILPR